MLRFWSIIIPVFILTGAFIQGCYFSGGRTDEFDVFDPQLYQKVDVEYDLSGSGDTTLIFLHDWNLSRKYWSLVADSLDAQYRVINADLPGHGGSGRDRKWWNMESMARDVESVIRKESVSKVVIVGHGLGAHVGLPLSELIGDKAIGLIDVHSFALVLPGISSDSIENFISHLSVFKREYPAVADDLARRYVRTRDRTVINRIVRDYKNADPKTALSIYKNMFYAAVDNGPVLERLNFPLTVLLSEEDSLDSSAMNTWLRYGYRIHHLPKTGHFPMVEQPHQLLSELRQAINSIP